MATAAPHMQLAPDLDTGPAQLGRGGVCEGCAAEPLALLQRREKQAAARHPVGRVWPFSRRRPARLAACGRLVGGEQPQPAWGCSGGSGGQVCTLAQRRKGAWSGPLNNRTLLTAHRLDTGANWRVLVLSPAHHRSRLSDSVKNGNALSSVHNV